MLNCSNEALERLYQCYLLYFDKSKSDKSLQMLFPRKLPFCVFTLISFNNSFAFSQETVWSSKTVWFCHMWRFFHFYRLNLAVFVYLLWGHARATMMCTDYTHCMDSSKQRTRVSFSVRTSFYKITHAQNPNSMESVV